MNHPWPKMVPPLTAEEALVQEDWMIAFHKLYPARYGAISRFNQTYPLRSFSPGCRTLEVGAGIGGHLAWEDLDRQRYAALELRADMAAVLARTYPQIEVIVGDAQHRLPFEDGEFDRVLAVHVLEHLPDLPAALDETRRVLRPDGRFSVVVPCEGGLAYRLGRWLTVRRTFERRYGRSYAPFIAREHVNRPAEIIAELAARFHIAHRAYWPLRVPSAHLNLCIGLTCVRPDGHSGPSQVKLA